MRPLTDGEGWSGGLGRFAPSGLAVDGGSVDPGRWPSIKIGGPSAWALSFRPVGAQGQLPTVS